MSFDKPFVDEIPEQILNHEGKPVLAMNIRDVDTGQIRENRVYLEFINEIIQHGSWNTAEVMNNIMNRINADSQNIAVLMLNQIIDNNIIVSGNESIEKHGINNNGRLFMQNNHSDFGILAENVSVGSNTIKIINASGYRFKTKFTNSRIQDLAIQNFRYSNSKIYEAENGDILVNDTWLSLFKIAPNFTVTNFRVGQSDSARNLITSIIPKLNAWINIWHSSNTVKGLQLYSTNGITTPAYVSTGNNTLWMSEVDEDTNQFYAFFAPYQGTAITVMRSAVMTNPSNLATSLTTVGTATIDQTVTYPRHILRKKGTQERYAYYTINADSTLNNNIIYSLSTNRLTFTRIRDIPYRDFMNFCENGLSFLGLGVRYIASNTFETDLVLFKGSTLTSTTPMIIPNISFRRGRMIMNVWEKNNVYYMCGESGLLGYSPDGENWTEIVINDQQSESINFTIGFTSNNNEIWVMGNGLCAIFEPFDSYGFINKKYVIDQESILVTGVSIDENDLVLSLNSPLTQSHQLGKFVLRTNDSTIQPNSRTNVTIELNNLFKHNCIVLWPQFTNLTNVDVTCEASLRNSTNELENFVPLELVNENELTNEWKQQTWFIKIPDERQVMAVSFWINNLNNQPIELFQLAGATFDEPYVTE